MLMMPNEAESMARLRDGIREDPFQKNNNLGTDSNMAGSSDFDFDEGNVDSARGTSVIGTQRANRNNIQMMESMNLKKQQVTESQDTNTSKQ